MTERERDRESEGDRDRQRQKGTANSPPQQPRLRETPPESVGHERERETDRKATEEARERQDPAADACM